MFIFLPKGPPKEKGMGRRNICNDKILYIHKRDGRPVRRKRRKRRNWGREGKMLGKQGKTGRKSPVFRGKGARAAKGRRASAEKKGAARGKKKNG